MPAERPNILLIITDHHAWFDHRRDGEYTFDLPAWEGFCARGVRFDRAYSVCPICTPARASMMTGMYPSAHGMTRNTEAVGAPDNRIEFRDGQRLFNGPLAEAGYRCGYVGKWHCGHERLPADYGMEGWSLPDYGNVYLSDAYRAYASARGLGDARARIEYNLAHPEWAGQTLTLHHRSAFYFMNGSGVLEGPPEAHEGQFVAHVASEKLRELAAGSQPWGLVASFWGPHQPYFPSEPWASMIDPESIPPYPSFDDDYAGKPVRHYIHRDLTYGCARKQWPEWSTWQRVLARAYGQQMQLDAAIGTLLATLDATGQAANTVVVWVSDHGDALASHGGLWDKASTCTEEVMRVLLAVRGPGASAGSTVTDLVSNMDVTATMLDAAGVAIPEGMHSRSLLPLCTPTGGADWPDEVVSEHHGHGENIIQRVVVSGKWKYVAAHLDGDELYDLEADPHEMQNLVGSPDHADVAAMLRDRLIRHIERTRDPIASRRLLYELRMGL